MSLKPGYSGSRRSADAENFVRFQKKWGEKIRKMGFKVARNKRKSDQGDDEDALHYMQQHKFYIQNRREK